LLPGPAESCQELPVPAAEEGRGQQADVGLEVPHTQASTQPLGCLAGVASVLWTSETEEDGSSIQPLHRVLLLPPAGNTSGRIRFVLAQYLGLSGRESLYVQGCVSIYAGSEAQEEEFWMVVFLEAGFSQWCYRSCRVVRTAPSLEESPPSHQP